MGKEDIDSYDITLVWTHTWDSTPRTRRVDRMFHGDFGWKFLVGPYGGGGEKGQEDIEMTR